MVSNIVFLNTIIVVILVDIIDCSCVNSNMLKPLTTLRENNGFGSLECNNATNIIYINQLITFYFGLHN